MCYYRDFKLVHQKRNRKKPKLLKHSVQVNSAESSSAHQSCTCITNLGTYRLLSENVCHDGVTKHGSDIYLPFVLVTFDGLYRLFSCGLKIFPKAYGIFGAILCLWRPCHIKPCFEVMFKGVGREVHVGLKMAPILQYR